MQRLVSDPRPGLEKLERRRQYFLRGLYCSFRIVRIDDIDTTIITDEDNVAHGRKLTGPIDTWASGGCTPVNQILIARAAGDALLALLRIVMPCQLLIVCVRPAICTEQRVARIHILCYSDDGNSIIAREPIVWRLRSTRASLKARSSIRGAEFRRVLEAET